MKKLILALIAATAAGGAAHAQTAGQAPGAYAGLGASSVDKLMSNGRSTGLKVFGGYEFDQKFGVEAGIHRLGRESLEAHVGGQQRTLSARGYNSYVAGKYNMPITEQLSAYGKLGLSYTVVRHSTSGAPTHKDDKTGLYAGLGFQYKVTDKVALTAEYERFGRRDGAIDHNDAWSLGLKYGF